MSRTRPADPNHLAERWQVMTLSPTINEMGGIPSSSSAASPREQFSADRTQQFLRRPLLPPGCEFLQFRDDDCGLGAVHRTRVDARSRSAHAWRPRRTLPTGNEHKRFSVRGVRHGSFGPIPGLMRSARWAARDRRSRLEGRIAMVLRGERVVPAACGWPRESPQGQIRPLIRSFCSRLV
jgi:hypothetical protein